MEPPRKSPEKTSVLSILLVTAVLSVGWLLFLRIVHAKASFGESNLQSNLVRLDDYFYGPNKPVALIGTSITGRLLPGYFREQGVSVANLGLDGSIPRIGIELLLRKRTLPETIFVETTAYPREPGQNDFEILSSIDGFTFKLARYLPIIRANARPSAVLYSWLKSKERSHSAGEKPSLQTKAGENGSLPGKQSGSTPEEARKAEIEAGNLQKALAELSARKVRVVLMRLPLGNSPVHTKESAPDLTDHLAEALSLEVINVAEILNDRGVPASYSDGLHMSAPYAKEAAKAICDWLKQSK